MKKNKKEKIVKIMTFVIMIVIILLLVRGNDKILQFFNIGKSDGDKNKMEEITENNILEHSLISPKEYKEKLESKKYIHLDIRTPEEYRNEKIKTGLNINFYARDFEEKLSRLDKDVSYIYHCRSGSRSNKAIRAFERLGFKEIYELEGGINNWKKNYNTIKL